MEYAIEKLARRYPQLLLPIRENMRQSEEYESAVLCGNPVEAKPDFRHPEEITLETAETPAGLAEIVRIGDREDFLHAYRALAYRCEPREIPDSVGACALRGVINWEKIHTHRKEYLRAGGEDWSEEFERFTADKSNYTDSLILLSCGNYSNVPAEELAMDKSAWREKSYTIRKYHELTHFICRGLYPENIDALRDEVIADGIGLAAAFGGYDPALARRFFGIWNGVFHEGGRLAHYVEAADLPAAVGRVNALIDEYAGRIAAAQAETKDLFELLLKIFP